MFFTSSHSVINCVALPNAQSVSGTKCEQCHQNAA